MRIPFYKFHHCRDCEYFNKFEEAYPYLQNYCFFDFPRDHHRVNPSDKACKDFIALPGKSFEERFQNWIKTIKPTRESK